MADTVRDLRLRLEREGGYAKKPAAVVEAGRLADLASLKRLHAAGADLNASWRQYRALHALIQERPHGESEANADAPPPAARLECLDWLLAHGADPEALGAWPPARALVVAAFVGEEAYVKRLLAGGAREDGFTFAATGAEKKLRAALAKDPDLARARDAGGLTVLQIAVGSRLGRRDRALDARLTTICGLLLEAGADPNALTRSWGKCVDAAYFAVGGPLARLALLLDRGADPHRALVSAAWRKEPFEEAALCLSRGADPDRALADRRPILNELIRWGQIPQALWLLSKGASPNVPDGRGWTAVHQAASRGNARLLTAVLANGGDRARRDAAGATPLDVARAMGKRAMAELLVAHGGSQKPEKRPTRPRVRTPRGGAKPPKP